VFKHSPFPSISRDPAEERSRRLALHRRTAAAVSSKKG
jgi:hypothetical protein